MLRRGCLCDQYILAEHWEVTAGTRLLGGDGEPRPDASGDAPCGEAQVLRTPMDKVI